MVNYSQHAPCNIPWHLHSHCQWHSHMPLAPYNRLHSHQQTWEHHTGKIHSGNNSLHYHLPIHMHPPPPLLTQPPPVTCTHFHIAGTATSDNSSNRPATHALTTMLFILLSFHPHPAVLTLPYWCGTFLICYYAWCGLPKSHPMPDAAFFLHSQSFHILLTFLFPYLRSYFHAMKV